MHGPVIWRYDGSASCVTATPIDSITGSARCAMLDVQRSAAKIKVNPAAVQAAFSSPWSSGQGEGQINQMKYLKRQMYRRTKLDLMRIHVLHSNRALS